jgi:hypothetical protein
VEEKPVPFLRRRSFSDLTSEFKLMHMHEGEEEEDKDVNLEDFEVIQFRSKSETAIKKM